MVKCKSVKTMPNNALAIAVYKRNVDAWRNPNRGSGSPTLLSKVQNLQSMVGDGGTLWVVVSRERHPGSRLYSLTYKLVECERFESRGPSAKTFGKYGVRGNPATSSFYPSNDAKLLLMSLRFASSKPIPSIKRVGQHLHFPRYLCQEDVLLLEEYAKDYIGRRSVFVSYAHEDAEYAVELKDVLERQGINVFRDEESILSGDYWREAIAKAIEDTMYFVVLCSAASACSTEVKREICQARKRKTQTRNSFIIIPIFLEGASVNDKAWSDLAAEFQARFWDPTGREVMFEKLVSDIKHERG